MQEKIRTFIAIPLQNNIKKSIFDLQNKIKEYKWHIRWVKPENIHLTLKFLGDINIGDIKLIESGICKSCDELKQFTLQVKGIGIFPDLNRPRVLWTGIHDSSGLLNVLQKKIEDQMNKIGFARDKKRFNAHLTMGRIKGQIIKSELKKALVEYEHFSMDLICQRVNLYKSVLKPRGSEYSMLSDIPLNKN